VFVDFSVHCYHSALIKHNPVDVATWIAHLEHWNTAIRLVSGAEIWKKGKQ